MYQGREMKRSSGYHLEGEQLTLSQFLPCCTYMDHHVIQREHFSHNHPLFDTSENYPAMPAFTHMTWLMYKHYNTSFSPLYHN